MIRSIIAACIFIATLGASLGSAQQAVQQNVQFKGFASFKQVVPGVDFYASNRKQITPYEQPMADAVTKLKDLFGTDLPKGAIFICSTQAQKDAVYEPRVIKAGYGWTLTVITAEARMQEMMSRMQSQMGSKVSPELLGRLKGRQSDMAAEADKQAVTALVQQVSYAVVQSMLVKDLQYRSWRLDDMGKSPLPDWLDIGIAAYVSGARPGFSYLQQNMDQTFPLEDVLTMARPFVSSTSDQGGGRSGGGGSRFGGADMGGQGMPPGGFGGGMGGQGMPQGGFNGGMGGQGMPQGGFGGGVGGQGMPQGGFGGGMNGQGMPQGGFGGNRSSGGQGAEAQGSGARGQGGFSGAGGQRGGMQRTLPKDQQDRQLFDGQAFTFFAYLVEKAGIEKVRELVRQARDGQESREYVIKPDVLGPDFEKIETEWAEWVKALKPQGAV